MQALSTKNIESGAAGPVQDVLIIGAGQAGARVAQGLRELGFAGTVAMIGQEPWPPYERPPLSKAFLLGEADEEALALQPLDYWASQDVALCLGVAVSRIDRSKAQVVLADGRLIGYRHLVVATGGMPRQLKAQGDGLDEVRVLRTLDDARLIRSSLQPGARLLVVGAGVIGLELASSARAMGVEVEVVEAGARPMARILCPQSSDWLADLHRASGVRLAMGVQLQRIDRKGSTLSVTVAHEDGKLSVLEADVVVAAIGVTVEQPVLTEAGLGDADGMEVDSLCRSPRDPRCYAAGDVARTPVPYFGKAQRQETWRNAENQARAVAASIVGQGAPYAEIPWMWSDQHGRNLQVLGSPQPGMSVVLRGEPGAGPFSILWLKDGALCGGVLIDSGRDRRVLEQLVGSRRRVDAESLRRTDVPLKTLL